MTLDTDGFYLLENADVAHRRVFVRADLDCPAENEASSDAPAELLDDSKLHSLVPTLRTLMEREALIVIGGHRGKPKGAEDRALSLEPCAARLAELLDTEILLPEENAPELMRRLSQDLRPDRLLLLENLAFDPRERAGDASLARQLLDGVEMYIGDCLAGPHEYASVTAMARLAKERAMGLCLEREVIAANRLRHAGRDRFLVLLGGRYEDRQPFLESLLRREVCLFPTGELAATLLRASRRDDKARSLPSPLLRQARTWLERAERAGVRVLLPEDLVVSRAGADPRTRAADQLGAGERLLAPGPNSEKALLAEIAQAETILVGGPLAEQEETSRSLLTAVAQSTAFTVISSDETLPVRRLLDERTQLRIGLISTAGDSFLELVQENRLAGLEALRKPA